MTDDLFRKAMDDALQAGEVPYPPTHPKGHRGLEQNKLLLPIELAVKQVAAQTGLPESAITELARQMVLQKSRRGDHLTEITMTSVLSQAVRTAAGFELAARKVAAAMNQPADVVRAKMLEMAKASIRPARDQCPHNPANRRTFRLAGKPYHYVQSADGRLHTEPGESPWT